MEQREALPPFPRAKLRRCQLPSYIERQAAGRHCVYGQRAARRADESSRLSARA